RRPGLSRNWTPALSCEITAASNLPMPISRMSPAGDRPLSCSAKMRHAASPAISPSCQGFFASEFLSACLLRSSASTHAPISAPQRSARGSCSVRWYLEFLSPLCSPAQPPSCTTLQQRVVFRPVLRSEHQTVAVNLLAAFLRPVKLLASQCQHLESGCIVDLILAQDGAPQVSAGFAQLGRWFCRR